MNGKYDMLIARFAEKDILGVMQTNRAHRNDKDFRKMRQFFSNFEFLKHQDSTYYE